MAGPGAQAGGHVGGPMPQGVTAGEPQGIVKGRWLSGFAALCVGQFLAHQTALTFSALIPILNQEWHLTASQAGLILGSFQFGQLAAYSTTIAAHATDFLDAYSRKLPVRMRYLRWVEATDNFSRIKVAFHVALTEEACKRVELLRALKKLLPDVGIFRVKPDGYVRDYVRVRMNKDYKLAKARPVVIKLLRP